MKKFLVMIIVSTIFISGCGLVDSLRYIQNISADMSIVFKNSNDSDLAEYVNLVSKDSGLLADVLNCNSCVDRQQRIQTLTVNIQTNLSRILDAVHVRNSANRQKAEMWVTIANTVIVSIISAVKSKASINNKALVFQKSNLDTFPKSDVKYLQSKWLSVQ